MIKHHLWLIWQILQSPLQSQNNTAVCLKKSTVKLCRKYSFTPKHKKEREKHLQAKKNMQYHLPDNTSIYTAEAHGIHQAITWITKNQIEDAIIDTFQRNPEYIFHKSYQPANSWERWVNKKIRTIHAKLTSISSHTGTQGYKIANQKVTKAIESPKIDISYLKDDVKNPIRQKRK